MLSKIILSALFALGFFCGAAPQSGQTECEIAGCKWWPKGAFPMNVGGGCAGTNTVMDIVHHDAPVDGTCECTGNPVACKRDTAKDDCHIDCRITVSTGASYHLQANGQDLGQNEYWDVSADGCGDSEKVTVKVINNATGAVVCTFDVYASCESCTLSCTQPPED